MGKDTPINSNSNGYDDFQQRSNLHNFFSFHNEIISLVMQIDGTFPILRNASRNSRLFFCGNFINELKIDG